MQWISIIIRKTQKFVILAMAEKTEFENSWSNLKNGENGNFTIVKFHFSIKLSKGSLQKKEKSYIFVKPAQG